MSRDEGAPPFDPEVIAALLDSYSARVGAELIPRTGDVHADAEVLYELPAVVLAHDGSADPVFTFANRAAGALWRTTPGELIGMPSRLSAEPEHRGERAEALALALRSGMVSDYSGVRIARDGTPFEIAGATLWTFVGRPGQAATFTSWRELDPTR